MNNSFYPRSSPPLFLVAVEFSHEAIPRISASVGLDRTTIHVSAPLLIGIELDVHPPFRCVREVAQ